MSTAPHFATPAADLLFEQCASPEAIAAELVKARRAHDAAQRRVAWLDDLFSRRIAEKEAGIWPPPREDDPR